MTPERFEIKLLAHSLVSLRASHDEEEIEL